MRIIADKNCTGKTKELIKESLETGAPILALTPLKKKSLKEKSKYYFNRDVNVVSIEDAKTYEGNILIDDIDEIVNDMIKKYLNNNNINITGVVVNL